MWEHVRNKVKLEEMKPQCIIDSDKLQSRHNHSTAAVSPKGRCTLSAMYSGIFPSNAQWQRSIFAFLIETNSVPQTPYLTDLSRQEMQWYLCHFQFYSNVTCES